MVAAAEDWAEEGQVGWRSAWERESRRPRVDMSESGVEMERLRRVAAAFSWSVSDAE